MVTATKGDEHYFIPLDTSTLSRMFPGSDPAMTTKRIPNRCRIAALEEARKEPFQTIGSLWTWYPGKTASRPLSAKPLGPNPLNP